MAGTIYLAAGTERVALRDIPRLIAQALHPALPNDTPRFVSYLMKEATDPELTAQWCGRGNSFPVPLTDEDLASLNAGPWAKLLPLTQEPDMNQSPRRLLNGPAEANWAAYVEALAAHPPTGWRVVETMRNPQMEQFILHDEAVKQHEKELERHVTTGRIEPRSPVTGIHEPTAAGEWLKDCVLPLAEFTQYVSGFNLEVRTRREFVRRPLVTPLVRELRKLSPDEIVIVSYEIVSRGHAVSTVRDMLGMFEDIEKRQHEGFFTLEEAAELICEENQQLSPRELIERWTAAKLGARRLVRGADRLAVKSDAQVRGWYDLVKVSEVDAWHLEQGDDYSLSASIAAAGDDAQNKVKGEHLVAWYDANLNASNWWALSDLTPREAAILLCEQDPHDNPTPESTTTSQTTPLDFKKLLRAFEDAKKRDSIPRSLDAWREFAKQAGLKYHEWTDDYAQARRDRSLGQSRTPEIDLSSLATRAELVAAFGSFTGMDMSWFKALDDTPALKAARKVAGRGQRGATVEPLFCPFEVMQWLIKPGRKKGRKLGEAKGWELLEKHFSRVYAGKSAADPR